MLTEYGSTAAPSFIATSSSRWDQWLESPSELKLPRETGSNHRRIFYPKIAECPGNMQKANKNKVVAEPEAISQGKGWLFQASLCKDLVGILRTGGL